MHNAWKGRRPVFQQPAVCCTAAVQPHMGTSAIVRWCVVGTPAGASTVEPAEYTASPCSRHMPAPGR